MSHGFIRFGRLFLMFLLLLLSTNLWAQQENWNRVLDQYEEICDQCISLRRNVELGVAVPSQSLTDLLGQLRNLRTRIQNAGGSMTKAQTDRFNRIRQKYDEAFGIASSATQRSAPSRQQVSNTPPPPVRQTDNPEPGKENPIILKDTVYLTIPVPVSEPEKVVSDDIFHTDVTPGVIDSLDSFVETLASTKKSPTRKSHFMVLGQWQMDYRNAFGLFLSYTPRKWGAFLSFRSNFVSPHDDSHAYPITDEGVFGNTGFFPSGRIRYSLTSLTLGPVYKLNPYLSFYLGAGLTSRHYQWEEKDASWSPLKSHTGRFMAIDMGVVGSYKRLSLGAGLLYSKRASMVLSLGVNF